MNNMLYNAANKKVTAVIDYDWASTMHACHEFYSGLSDLGGGTHPEDKSLQAAVLSGDLDDVPRDLTDETKQAWETAKVWDRILASRGGIKPSSIAGIGSLEKLRMLENSLGPFPLANEVLLKRFSQEKLDGIRTDTRSKPFAFLGKHRDHLS